MTFTLKKAITDFKLSASNFDKLEKLDEISVEFMRICQFYCDLLSFKDSTPNKYANLPEIETQLSVRWQRVAWQQACGIVKSWKSNKREKKPVLKNIVIQANINVAKLEKNEDSKSFDYWIKLSTLEFGKPILLPVKLYKHAAETIEKYPKLFNGILLKKLTTNGL